LPSFSGRFCCPSDRLIWLRDAQDMTTKIQGFEWRGSRCVQNNLHQTWDMSFPNFILISYTFLLFVCLFGSGEFCVGKLLNQDKRLWT
jgi:hypothetical protein